MMQIERIAVETRWGTEIIEPSFMTTGTHLVAAEPERLTAEQAKAESEERSRRACNYAPIERPMELPVTVSGVSILGLEIARASGMRPRRHPLGPLGRLWRRIAGV